MSSPKADNLSDGTDRRDRWKVLRGKKTDTSTRQNNNNNLEPNLVPTPHSSSLGDLADKAILGEPAKSSFCLLRPATLSFSTMIVSRDPMAMILRDLIADK